MPQLNGVETLQQLSTHYPDVKAIMLSMHDDPEIALECLRLGAASYLLKECSLSEMMEAITQVQQNGAYLSAFAESAFASKKHHINGLQQMQIEKGFSDRDLKVLQLLCDGFTSKHIAEQIHVSKKNCRPDPHQTTESLPGQNLQRTHAPQYPRRLLQTAHQ
jgi:DNA-binding NarL/FixJ family response regulator